MVATQRRFTVGEVEAMFYVASVLARHGDFVAMLLIVTMYNLAEWAEWGYDCD